jgi:hypothetical protein
MELDEFKEMWNRADQLTVANYNVTELIYRDSKSPLAAIEKNLKAGLFIFPFVALLFTGQFLSSDHQSPTRVLLFAILFIEFLFSLLNYGLVKKIQQPKGDIKASVLSKVSLLQKLCSMYVYVQLGLYALMAVLLEISMYFQLDSNFNGWAKVNPVIRVGVYVIFLVVQLVIKRASQKKLYGRYLDQLNKLALQLD